MKFASVHVINHLSCNYLKISKLYSIQLVHSRMNGYAHLDDSGSSQQPEKNGEIRIPLGPTNQPRVLVRAINDGETTFHLSGVELAYANSLRRVIMADVPTICESIPQYLELQQFGRCIEEKVEVNGIKRFYGFALMMNSH